MTIFKRLNQDKVGSSLRKLLGILLLFFLAQNQIRSEVYYYHPSTVINLGAPYDTFSPSENLAVNDIFKWSEEGSNQESGVNEVSFRYSEVSSMSDLSRALSIDLNAEASFAFGDASSSFQLDRFVSNSETEIIIAISAIREYKPRKKNGTLSLSDTGKSLLSSAFESDRLHLWRRVAGSDVVVETVSGHAVTLFYRFKTFDRSKLETLRAAISASWSSGSASANMVDAAQAIDSSVTVTVDYSRIGGTAEASALHSILTSQTGDVSSVKNALKIELQNGTPENARLLRCTTISVGNLSEVVFGTDGEFQMLSDYYDSILDARILHFERLLVAKERLHKAQRLLDEKPDRLYLENGKARLFELKNKLSESVAAIHDEYESYNRLNPENVEVTTSAGSNLPLLSPVEYFSKPFVKLAQWTRTNGESPRGGWGNYNDAEFHDFYVSYYPNLEIILPEFVERLRLFRNYLPIATVRKNQIREIVESGGSFSPYYKTDYSNIKVWTHGANHMPASFNNWKNEMNAIEAQISYILEVTSADGDKHYVDLGNISNNSKGVISLNKLAAAGIPVSGVVGAVSGGSSSKIRDMIKWIEENP